VAGLDVQAKAWTYLRSNGNNNGRSNTKARAEETARAEAGTPPTAKDDSFKSTVQTKS
jgi:hypothetical protein